MKLHKICKIAHLKYDTYFFFYGKLLHGDVTHVPWNKPSYNPHACNCKDAVKNKQALSTKPAH